MLRTVQWDLSLRLDLVLLELPVNLVDHEYLVVLEVRVFPEYLVVQPDP